MNLTRRGLAAFVLAVAGSTAAAAPTRYVLTDLGVAAGYVNSFGYGLSDDGRYVTGWLEAAGGATNAFRWSTGSGIELLALGNAATASRGFGVNDNGTVAGEMSFGTRREATLWATGSAPFGLGTLSNAGSSVAFAVNNAGTAAGWSDSSAGTRAFARSASAPMAGLGALPGGTQSRAYAINAGGSIAGWGTSPDGDRGFAATPALQSVGVASAQAGSRTRAFGVSNHGWVTGDASDPGSGDSAFVWSPDTGLVTLGRLTGALRSFGGDVNSAALAVGWNDGLTGVAAGEAAFVWSTADGMSDLNTLLVNGSGWQVQRARSINDAGLIVGQAVDALGRSRAVLLTPVPEPGSWALMVVGGALLAAHRWRAARRSSACSAG